MFLIYCPECSDVVLISKSEHRSCFCGKASARYFPDREHVMLFGEAILIKFDKRTFDAAILYNQKRNKSKRFSAKIV